MPFFLISHLRRLFPANALSKLWLWSRAPVRNTSEEGTLTMKPFDSFPLQVWRRPSSLLLPSAVSWLHGMAMAMSSRAGGFVHEEGNGTAFPKPPVLKKKPYLRSAHGLTWDDPYHWISERTLPAVTEHLRRENAYVDRLMGPTLPLQRSLLQEIRSRMNNNLRCPPEPWGPWLYYTEVPDGKDLPTYCRKPLDIKDTFTNALKKNIRNFIKGKEANAKECILIDLNEIAEKFGYAQLGTCKISCNHRFLAYTVDLHGEESFTLFVKDLETGHCLPKPRVNGVVSVQWASDNSTLFYTTIDQNLRPSRVIRTSLKSFDPVVLLEDKNGSHFVDIARTKDWQFITVNVNSKSSSEVHLINAKCPYDQMVMIMKRRPGVEYFVEHHEGNLLILSNYAENLDGQSRNYQLFQCPTNNPTFDKWQKILPVEDDVVLYDMDVFKKHLVLYQRKHGLPQIHILSLPLFPNKGIQDSVKPCSWTFPLPKGVSNITAGVNQDFDASAIRIAVSSPIMPEAVLDCDLITRKYVLLQQEGIQSKRVGIPKPNADPIDLSNRFACEHLNVKRLDGVNVPLTLVYSRTNQRDGTYPALLMGYGAYGEVLEEAWCSDRLSLLDRGWVLAFAHVRGGGELGKGWHQCGKLLRKRNSIDDFIACAEFLADEGFAHRSRLCAQGISAGGLLVSAAINQKPSLFRAVVLKVPFLDLCNTMLQDNLPLTVPEYEEWGDPKCPEVFDYIRSYSPYDNIQKGALYPAMLLLASFLDTRVGYWEAAKWVARVRECTEQHRHHPTLLKTSMNCGHFGEGGRYRHTKMTALEYSFLIKMTDIVH